MPIRRRNRAFSLIELVMVILITAILSVAIITDIISSTFAARLQAACFKLKSDIMYAQELAVTQQIHHGVVFDPALDTYAVYRQNITTIVNNPLTLRAFTVNYPADPNFRGVNLISVSFGTPNTNQVEFDSLGVPYSNSTAALAANGTVALSLGGSSATVTVTNNTGKVN